MNEFDKAIDFYNKAIQLDKNKITVYEYRAYAYEKKEDYFSALFDMNEAIKLDPEYNIDEENDPIEIVFLSKKFKTTPIFEFTILKGGFVIFYITFLV